MTPEELRQAGQRLFGTALGWQSRLADALGVDRSSVTRYLSNGVPGPVSAAVRCWLEKKARGEAIPLDNKYT